MPTIVVETLNCGLFVIRRNLVVSKGCLEILVAHPTLHGSGINPLHEGVREECVMKLMQADKALYPGSGSRLFEGSP